MIKGFTPNWFTVGMGTGILALDAFLLPAGPAWLRDVGTGLWVLNMVLVAVMMVLLGLRALLDPEGTRAIFRHPLQSMFFGAVPMAMTTVVNGFFDIGPRFLGPSANHIGVVLWIPNAAIALASVLVIPLLMFVDHDHDLSQMTAVWLMPIVPAEVVAASSGIMIPHLTSLALQQTAFIGTVVLWALSVPMAFLLLGVLFLRLAVHRLPPGDLAMSTWITLGTLGTGIMGLMLIAKDSVLVFPQIANALAGTAAFMALILWGLGLWWMFHSVFISGSYVRKGALPFNIGWWGLTFPLGVFDGGTILLYQAFPVELFHWASVSLFALLAAFWLIVAAFTLRYLTRLFQTPHPAEDLATLYPEAAEDAM